MTGDLYVESVMRHVPNGMPMRDQIAAELRSHIADRVGHGMPIDEVVRQLGDPLTLAESYLTAVPLASAPLGRRVIAKVIDVAASLAVSGLVGLALWAVLPEPIVFFAPVACILGAVFGFGVYTVVAEYRTGQTIGKRLMGIRVVRESGARITLGQSLLRQLPFLAEFFFIDALFALFTERRQRAFELLTKTRAVAILICVGLLTLSA